MTPLLATFCLTLLSSVTAIAGSCVLGLTNWVEGPAAGTDSVAMVVSPAMSDWTASTTDSWLHVVTASGAGSTNVIYSFDANPGATRTGTLTIGGQTLTLTQAGSRYTAANPLIRLALENGGYPQGVAVDRNGNVFYSQPLLCMALGTRCCRQCCQPRKTSRGRSLPPATSPG